MLWYCSAPLSISRWSPRWSPWSEVNITTVSPSRPLASERTQHPPDRIVDAGDHAGGQRPRLLRLARRDADGVHAGEIGLAGVALVDDGLHQGGRRPVVALEGFRHRELLGLVHVPVFAGWIERMVRIGKRHHQEERRIGIGVVEIGLGAIAEERAGVELLRDRGAIGLRHRVVVRQRVLWTEQVLRLGIARFKPAIVVASRLIAVRANQRDVVEAVERRDHPRLLGVPVFRRLLLVLLAGEIVAQRLSQIGRGLVIALTRRRPLDDRRPGGEILQMALADQRGAVARLAQQVDERYGVHGQRNPVRAHAMHRRHPAGHQAGAVRHADRACDVELVERGAPRRDRIDRGVRSTGWP